MASPVLDALGMWAAFQTGKIYPGSEDNARLDFEFDNGTTINQTWSAIYLEASDTGPLTTAGDFYNYFVLGIGPANVNTTEIWWPHRSLPNNESTTTPAADPLTVACSQDDQSGPSWCQSSFAAFPDDPVVAQEDLDFASDEVVTGYILDDISTGVLSIPSFQYTSNYDDDDTFRDAIQEFVSEMKARNVTRILIDLQQNRGGNAFRAYDTFKLFFPSLDPNDASHMRKHDLANVLGSAYTYAWDKAQLDTSYAANEWVVSNRIDADTNSTFSSWREYFDNEAGYSRPASPLVPSFDGH